MNDIDLPIIPIPKITDEILTRVNAFTTFLSVTENIEEAKKGLAEKSGLSLPTVHWYLIRLRKLFKLPSRAHLSSISKHPQLQHALEYLFTRKERSDKASLASAKNLSVIVPTNGELLSVEDFLKSLYPREGVNAASCYRVLAARCLKRQVVKTPTSPPSQGGDIDGVAILADLPSQSSVNRFLRQWKKECFAVQRARTRKHDWETQQQAYVTRDVTQYQPGELWIGDHTELDFIVINEQGKPDRRWISAFIDIRTGLLIGYHLSWQPNSQTIAAAFRNGVLSNQIKAFTGEKFERVNITNIPQTVMMDNGKDYRSKYTQRVFGNIDFDDNARISVQRITKLHYTQPYHGQSKAQMERWFGSIQTMLKYLPGFKGNQYQKKPDSLQTDLKSGNILTVKQFDAAVAVAINSYNNRVHRSLKGETPLQNYLTHQSHQRSIDMRVLDFLMMKVQGRRIRRCQVTLLNSEYYSEQLMPFNDQLADVYYDPNDLGFISIYVNGDFAAVASNKEMIGQDERGWQKLLHERKTGEKKMREEIAVFRQGISDHDARMMLLEGELLNMNVVSHEMLKQNSSSISIMTGLESAAKQNQEELDREKQIAEVHEKRKKANKSTLSLVAVNEKIK
jgi:transposase InsO family protein